MTDDDLKRYVYRAIELFRIAKPDGLILDGLEEAEFVRRLLRVHHAFFDTDRVDQMYAKLVNSPGLKTPRLFV